MGPARYTSCAMLLKVEWSLGLFNQREPQAGQPNSKIQSTTIQNFQFMLVLEIVGLRDTKHVLFSSPCKKNADCRG